MTRTLTLAALAFTLVALPAWSSARACGGYSAPDTLINVQIESVVRTHFARNRGQVRLVDVARLGVVETAAEGSADHLVRVRFARGEAMFLQVLRVNYQRGAWHVVGGEAPLRA